MNCNHVVPYWSVVPPSHCPRCGQCLHPAHFGPYQPVMPYQPYQPPPWRSPWYWSTITSSTTHTNTNGSPAVMA
jgi:hypothetical protein